MVCPEYSERCLFTWIGLSKGKSPDIPITRDYTRRDVEQETCDFVTVAEGGQDQNAG